MALREKNSVKSKSFSSEKKDKWLRKKQLKIQRNNVAADIHKSRHQSQRDPFVKDHIRGKDENI